MSRQRSAINSFPEIIELDQISVSGNSGMSQQAPINNMPSPIDSRSPTDIASSEQVLCVNALNHEVQSFSGWNSGESSSGLSSRNHIDVAETKMEERWPSSINAHAVRGSRSEERQYEPNNVLPGRVNIDVSGNHVRSGALFLLGSSSGHVPPTLNPDGNGGHNIRAGLGPNNFNSDGLEIEHAFPLSVSSNDASTSSGSSGSRPEENNVGAGSSVGGWGLSCKRKALEGTSGNSHPGGGSTSCIPQTENAGRLASCHNASSSFCLSSVSQNSPSGGPPEQPSPRISFGMRGVAFNALPSATPSGNTHPGRGNHGHHPEPVRFNMSATEHARHSNLWSSHQSPRPLSFSDSLDMRSTAATAASSNTVQSQLHAMHTSNSTRNMHPFSWYEPSSLIAGNASNFLNPGERAAVLQEEMNLRSIQRNSAEHPMVAAVTDMRNISQESTGWNSSSGNMSSSGSIPSTRNGPSSSSRPSPSPGRFHHQNPTTHNQQRFSEFAPWSLFPSVDSESGGHSGHFPALSSGPSASAQETATSSGSSIQGRIQLQPLQRSAFLVEGQPDDLLGMPRSLRALAADIEGRHRLISEIRQVLNAMRRGENLRVEDYMLFDPFIYHGMAEMHDRHRDMRLDVDNMSYEELLALEERIGDVNTGLGEETIMKSMKHQKFVSMVTESSRDLEPCCICQEEYADGDDLGVLDCGHDFHTDCIKQWLMHKNLCPICKMTALLQS